VKDIPTRTAIELNRIVTAEVTELWLRPGERLIVSGVPACGHVGALIAGQRHVPYIQTRAMPAMKDPARWPLPTAEVRPEDWTDDPTLGYWVTARDRGRYAVRAGDHLAATHGLARLTITDQRVALVCPTKFLLEPPDPTQPLTTFEETGSGIVRGFSAAITGISVPPKPLLRVDFADGSTLFARDLLAPGKAPR
jgi:hypothetical protein